MDEDAVSIELDEDIDKENEPSFKLGNNTNASIGKPLTMQTQKFAVDSRYRIGDLSTHAVQILIAHMDLPAFGSLRNYQFLATHMGVSSEVLPALHKDGTKGLLEKFRDSQLDVLLHAIEASNRVDTMFSLKKLHEENKLLNRQEEAFRNLNHLANQNAGTSAGDSGVSISIRAQPADILIVHNEYTQEETKAFRWFMKNLRQPQFGLDVCDIFDVVGEENVLVTAQSAFARAHHIVVCYNPSQAIEENKNDQANVKNNIFRFVLGLMDQEFNHQGMRNTRFRPVWFSKFGDANFPMGWASATIPYFFPDNARKLFERLKRNADQSGVTM